MPWVCLENRKCTFDDKAFEFLSQKVFSCGALIFGTPVYRWDTGGMVSERMPFPGLEERLLWYDALPYLGMSRAAERRLLADLTTMALPAVSDPEISGGLAHAGALAASGRLMDSMAEVTREYETDVQAFEKK